MINGRNRRKGSRTRENEEMSIKKFLSVVAILLATGIIAFIITVTIYNNSLEEIYDDLESKEIADLTTIKNDNRNIVEETSASFGKTVEEMKNEIETTSVENEEVAEIKAKTNQKKEKIEDAEKPVQEKKEEKIAEEKPKVKGISCTRRDYKRICKRYLNIFRYIKRMDNTCWY